MSDYGHRKMIVWKNINEIEKIVQQRVLKNIPRIKRHVVDQIDRSCDSVGANFIEGYYSSSTKEYIRFLKYSKRSLAELQGWVQRSFNKGFVGEELLNEFEDLSIRTMYLLNRLINALKDKIASNT